MFNHPLEGRVFCFTGTLRSMTRTRAQQLVKQLGAQATDRITRETNTLVAGDHPGNKLEKAQAKGITVWDERCFTETMSKHTKIEQQKTLF